jgi:hypothetical protein
VKFWDTIAKMCGVKIDTSQWGRRGASAAVGGRMDQWLERADELSGEAHGHRFKVQLRDHSFTATIDGHGLRLRDTERDYGHGERVAQIGFIAIERIRPMVGKSGSVQRGAPVINPQGKVVGWEVPMSAPPNTQAAAPTVLS